MIDDPFAHMEAFHKEMDQVLLHLQEAADRGDAQKLQGALESLQAITPEWRLHTQDEEISLFPRLRPLLPSVDVTQLQVLEEQHKEAAHAYAQLQEFLARWSSVGAAEIPFAELARFRQQLEYVTETSRFHVSFENRELLRLARRLLTPGQTEAIRAEMLARRRASLKEAASLNS